ncbi:ABC transporter ATP-binding protein [Halodurantibacterium flavum]|uniref:ABC transporter ATP-binding protein n=1 Tax=Halodurantibacterium flavum TaxID=1382802 RepID=A0ABW4S3D8_9RHOB
MLELRNVESGYGAAKVLHGLSLTVSEGEVITLMGRNGMGKTTTVRTIMGQLRHDAGETSFRGTPIRGVPMPKIARLGIGLVPEGRMIFPNLTVEENLIASSGNRSGSANPWTVDRLFTLFPKLEERRHSMGNLLSGGEQQMLAIGRALMTNPHLLILDEATEGLAPVIRDVIWTTLRQLKDLGQAILVIDKNIAALSRFADRHYVMEKGVIVWEGDGPALERDLEHVRTYLVA